MILAKWQRSSAWPRMFIERDEGSRSTFGQDNAVRPITKQPAGTSPPAVGSGQIKLALRELEAAASLGAAVFLALHNARIARQEATLLQHRTQIRLIGDERFRDAMAQSACLPRQ